MPDLLESSSYSVQQAKRRIAEFEREISGFANSRPYKIVIDLDAEGTTDTHKVVLVNKMPEPLRGIAFEVISHLRAALDQAGRACAGAGRRKKAKFPFGDTEAEVLSRRTGDSRHIPPEVFDAMVALKPYETGNRPLWALNKLCNAGKHDLVIPLPLTTGDSYTHHFEAPAVGPFSWPPKGDPAKNEMIIARVPHGSKPKYNLQIQLYIAIGEVDGVKGTEAIGLFHVILSEVERGLAAIGTAAAQIGLA